MLMAETGNLLLDLDLALCWLVGELDAPTHETLLYLYVIECHYVFTHFYMIDLCHNLITCFYLK